MKKVKMVSVFFMLFVIMMITSGCNTYTEVNVDTNGKGSVKIKLEVPKDAIENGGYTKAKTPEELVAILDERCSESINMTFSVDKEASSENDYIIVSLNFDSIDEFNSQIDEVIMQYNMMVASSDVEDLFGYIPSMTNSVVYETEAIKKYFEENGIKVDTTDRNVRKFVKLVKSCLVFDEETIENDERLKMAFWKGTSNVDTKFEIEKTVEIVEKNGEKDLKIQKMAIDCVNMYMQRLLIKYQTEIFDLQGIQASTESVSGMETKEILGWTFEGICLADKVKDVLNKEGISDYSLSNLTPYSAVQIFNEEFVEEFQMTWNREYNNYQEEKRLEKNQAEGFENVETAVYKDRNQSVTFSFGDNIVKFTDDEFLDVYADNKYLTISSKNTGTYEETGVIDLSNNVDDNQQEKSQQQEDKQSSNDNVENEKGNVLATDSDEKARNKEITEIKEKDNTPKTGDFSFLTETMIIGMTSLVLIFILRKKMLSIK